MWTASVDVRDTTLQVASRTDNQKQRINNREEIHRETSKRRKYSQRLRLKQGSLTNAKVSAQQQYVYEGP